MKYMSCVFFFNDTATTEIYTLSLHDALPISNVRCSSSAILRSVCVFISSAGGTMSPMSVSIDRKSTRLNSSHSQISYAVFCLKKKNIYGSTNYHHGRVASVVSQADHICLHMR